jgi:hypothetical protein
MMMKILFYTLLCSLVTGNVPVFAEPEMNPSAETATIVLDGRTVRYAGRITDENIEHFLDVVNGKKVSMLVIASSGGDINAGMTMGEWVYDNHVDVVVERMCMSSCANYVFTAARHKTINVNAIVAWHGSILQEHGLSDEELQVAVIAGYNKLSESEKREIDVKDLIRQSIRQMQEYRMSNTVRQRQFFSKIGVDEYICRVGNEKYGAKDFFIVSVKDMEQFGVRNVTAPENYEKTDLTPFRRTGKSVEFVAVSLNGK